MTLIFAALIIFLSSIIQGATSFGFSLIALPLLGLFYPLKIIVPTLVTLSLVLNLIVLLKLKIRPHIKPHIKQLMLLTICAIITIPLGVFLLIFINEELLKTSIGIMLIIVAFIMLKGFQINLKNKNLAYIITGILSGVLNGSVSLSGPPVIVLMANDSQDKNVFRANLSFVFLILNVFTIALYLKNGLYNNPELQDLLKLFPFMIIGTYMGIYLGNKIDDLKFKKIVLYLLIIMGIMNLL